MFASFFSPPFETISWHRAADSSWIFFWSFLRLSQQFTLLLTVVFFPLTCQFLVNKTRLGNFCVNQSTTSDFSAALLHMLPFDQLWKSHIGSARMLKSKQGHEAFNPIRRQLALYKIRAAGLTEQVFRLAGKALLLGGEWLQINAGLNFLWVYLQHKSEKVSEGKRNSCCWKLSQKSSKTRE